MTFASLTFIVFLGCLFLGYYLIPQKTRWLWLLVGSYIFYCWLSPKMTLFLLFSTATTWGFSVQMGNIQAKRDSFLSSESGKKLDKEVKKQYKDMYAWLCKRSLTVCLLLNLGILAIIKYLPRLSGGNLPNWWIVPLGISFYTFQSVGYCIDVYRELIPPQRNPLKYALYVSFFPQICQGPIGRYAVLAPQLYEGHPFNYDRFVLGVTRILWGFFKKLAVANSIGAFVDSVYAFYTDYTGTTIAVATVLYGIQLYADFSGYMDIAIGTGWCLGINLSENFKTPYFSASIAEFWRRWHITLGAWFRDYLYYPVLRSKWCQDLGKELGKSGRKKLAGTATTVIALAVNWLLVGMWHGSSWNFVAYGVYHGSFIILAVIFSNVYVSAKHRLHIREKSVFWKTFQMVRTFSIVSIGYLLFRASGLNAALQMAWHVIRNLQPRTGLIQLLVVFIPQNHLLIFAMFPLLLAAEILDSRRGLWEWLRSLRTFPRWLVTWVVALLLYLCTNWNAADAGNFLYFRF